MSNHGVNLNDPRHADRYKDGEGLSYELDLDHPLSMYVSSSRFRGVRYRTWIEGSDAFCNCATLPKDTCKHRAVCIAQFYPSIWLQWKAIEDEQVNRKRLKLLLRSYERACKERTESVVREMRAVDRALKHSEVDYFQQEQVTA
jgi:uncharacterized Zn finger protein